MSVSPYVKDLIERFVKTLVQGATAAGIWVPASHSLHLQSWQTMAAVTLTAGVGSLVTSGLSKGVGSPENASAVSSGQTEGPDGRVSDPKSFAAVWEQASTPSPTPPPTPPLAS